MIELLEAAFAGLMIWAAIAFCVGTKTGELFSEGCEQCRTAEPFHLVRCSTPGCNDEICAHHAKRCGYETCGAPLCNTCARKNMRGLCQACQESYAPRVRGVRV